MSLMPLGRVSDPFESSTHPTESEIAYLESLRSLLSLPKTASPVKAPGLLIPLPPIDFAIHSVAGALLNPKIASKYAPSIAPAPFDPRLTKYNQLVEHIPAEELRAIEYKMASLTDIDAHLSHIITGLESGNYMDLHKDAIYYALLGVRQNKIPTKVAIRISDIETLRHQNIPFKVFDFIGADGKFQEGLLSILDLALNNHLTEKQRADFIHACERLPPIDRKIIHFRPLSKRTEKPPITSIIHNPLLFNLFGVVHIRTQSGHLKKRKLFCSLELFSALLKARFGKDATIPNPVFGLSSPSAIRLNGLTNTRDIACAYLVPNADTSNRLVIGKEADHHACLDCDFKYHDMYHLFVTSSWPKEIKELSICISDRILRFSLSNKDSLSLTDYKAARSVRWILIDMNFTQRFMSQRVLALNIPLSPEEIQSQKRISESVEHALFYQIDFFFKKYCVDYIKKHPFSFRIADIGTRPFDSFETLYRTFSEVINSIPPTPAFERAKHALQADLSDQIDALKKQA